MWIGPWNKLDIKKPASNLRDIANSLNSSDQLRAKAVVTRLEILNSILASMFDVICCLKR